MERRGLLRDASVSRLTAQHLQSLISMHGSTRPDTSNAQLHEAIPLHWVWNRVDTQNTAMSAAAEPVCSSEYMAVIPIGMEDRRGTAHRLVATALAAFGSWAAHAPTPTVCACL